MVGIGFFSLCFLMTSLGGQFSAKRPGDSPFTVRAEGKPVGSQVITARSPVTTVVGNEQAGNMLRARRGFLDCHQPADRPAHFAHQENARGGERLSPRETPPTPLIYTSISLYTCFHPCSVPTWPFSDPHEVIVQLLVPVFNEYLLVATDPAGLLCSCRRIEQTKRKWLTSEVPLVRSGHAKKTSYCEHELLLMGGLK